MSKRDKLKENLKRSNDKRQFEQKKLESLKEKIENTGKKVDKGRRESDTEEEVNSKITGAHIESPAH